MEVVNRNGSQKRVRDQRKQSERELLNIICQNGSLRVAIGYQNGQNKTSGKPECTTEMQKYL